jgi:DNA modification methylase
VFAPNTLVRGGVLDVVRSLPLETVAATVCSPPYWGQRVYADEVRVRWGDGCLNAFGREESPEDYVAHTLEILKAMLPVLRRDGTIWWNIADSYMTRTIMRSSSMDRVEHYGGKASRWANNPHRRTSYGHVYLKDKDLPLIPFQIAIGAQMLGYYLRSVIVWSKQQAQDDFRDQFTEGAANQGELKRSHVPEIVSDRPVTGHEYILLLTKSERYQYYPYAPEGSDEPLNVRSVWTFPPAGAKSNHGARFPDELPRRCIRLATREGDLVFDPFAGEGTTLRVARDLKRLYFGCDISATYVRAARAVLDRTMPKQPQPGGPELPKPRGRKP